MNLFDKLKEYILGVTVTSGICVVTIKVKDGWVTQGNGKVGVDNTNDILKLFGVDHTVSLDEVLQLLERIVSVNKENEAKISLFNDKVNEMNTIFNKHPLDKLKTLKFTFSESVELPKANVTFITNQNEQVAQPVNAFVPDNSDPYMDYGYEYPATSLIADESEIRASGTNVEGVYNDLNHEDYSNMTLSEIAAMQGGNIVSYEEGDVIE